MSHKKKNSLIEQTVENLLEMINVQKKLVRGDKLPNENDLAAQLMVSRGTLREAVRILETQDILKIERGKGTFITGNTANQNGSALDTLAKVKTNLQDLMEIRLIIEPEAAYLASIRANDYEIERILHYGKINENKILSKEDRTEEEQLFHYAISQATHNDFMKNLMPIINQAIHKGVMLSKQNSLIDETTLNDHRMLMEFLQARNAEGARTAMKMHILHAIDAFNLKME